MYEDEHLEAQYEDANGGDVQEPDLYDQTEDVDESEKVLWGQHQEHGWIRIMRGTFDEVLRERDFRRDNTIPGLWKNFAVADEGTDISEVVPH